MLSHPSNQVVANGGLEVSEELAKISDTNDGDDIVEDVAALALADEGEGAIEVFGDLGGDAVDEALVERGLDRGGQYRICGSEFASTGA
ncbi:hypothetical protein E2542_SST03314 [Spatholobus suberectus]|nr:hypothetical protein E2542_SST03314 [Spatholobus suberectus]